MRNPKRCRYLWGLSCVSAVAAAVIFIGGIVCLVDSLLFSFFIPYVNVGIALFSINTYSTSILLAYAIFVDELREHFLQG